MKEATLIRANELASQIEHLEKGLARIDDYYGEDGRPLTDIILKGAGIEVALFSGTSSLAYDLGVDHDKLREEILTAIRPVINKHLIARRKEFEKLSCETVNSQ